MRSLTFVLICGALIAFRAHSSGSLAAASFDGPNGDLAKLAPPDPALAVIESLQQPGITAQQLNARIESLGWYRTSPAAARALVKWINYVPPWCRQRTGPSSEYLAPGPMDRPGVRGLIALGEFAAPFLVEGDIAISIEYRDSKMLRVHPERLLVRFVAYQSPKVAKRAVEAALQRMTDSPQNADLQAACSSFVAHIVSRYQESERSTLFPAAACALVK